MKKNLITITVVLCCLLGAPRFIFGEDKADKNIGIVPESELKIAQDLKVDGPTETHGIESSELLGTMSLTGEFEGTENHMMRVRKVTLLPGGQVAVHQHTSRPGVAYILEGEAVEHRDGESEPLIRVAGDIALEKTGTIHWWKNESSEKVVVLVVDIVHKDTK